MLTATDSTLFPAVHATALSLKEQRISYAVIDNGLLDDQIAQLHELDVMILEDHLAGTPSTGSLSQMYPAIPIAAWKKPKFCTESPFLMTAWIDADAIPLAYSHELFQWSRGFVTMDHFVDNEWAEQEYRPLVNMFGGDFVERINAGVFAFPRTAGWLARWRQTCMAILVDKEMASVAHCRDQSALVATLSILKPNERPVVLSQPHWNYPADGCSNTRMNERMKDYPKTGPELLNFARARHPGVSVVHWMGPVKPWKLAKPEEKQ